MENLISQNVAYTPIETIHLRRDQDGAFQFWLYIHGSPICTLSDGAHVIWHGVECVFSVGNGGGWQIEPANAATDYVGPYRRVNRREVRASDGGNEMTGMKFNDLLYGDFTPTEKDQRLYELAKQYHEETEAYDQRVCRGRTERDIAMPIDAYEYGLISRNALKVRKRLLDENQDIEREELYRAISKYAPD